MSTTAPGSRRVTGDGTDRPAVAQRHRWTQAPPTYHLPPRTALAAVRDLNTSDPLVDERLMLAALGMPALADDDEEATR